MTQLVDKADWEFLQHMLEAMPYQLRTILTDRAFGTPLVRETMARSIQFADQRRNRNTIYSRPMRFDMICEANGTEHCLTKPNHPWTNGEVERIHLQDLNIQARQIDPESDPPDAWNEHVMTPKRLSYAMGV